MERASHRVLGLPLRLQMADAAANGTHRHLPSRGGPADRVLPLTFVARAPLRRPPRRKPTGDRALLTCTQHAVRRALKLPLLPQMAGATADGTHGNLPSSGIPANRGLPLKSARACMV